MPNEWFSPTRRLNARQIATVEKVLDAAEAFLDERGYEDLTLRLVAADAQVSAATAYTYFSSKNHLCAGVFCRAVLEAGAPEPQGNAVERVEGLVRHLSEVIAAQPALASAATRSLMAPEDDVAGLRLVLGTHWARLFREAVGEAGSAAVLDALLLAFSGALLHAGMGVLAYEDLGDHLARAVETILLHQIELG